MGKNKIIEVGKVVEIKTLEKELDETKEMLEKKRRTVLKLENDIKGKNKVNEKLDAIVCEISKEKDELNKKVIFLEQKIEDTENMKDAVLCNDETNNNFEKLLEPKTNTSNHQCATTKPATPVKDEAP
jgi:chromosome segregation ATPase